MLEKEAQLTGLTFWEYLDDEHAGQFPFSVLRTLQRRVKLWKATQGPDKVVIFRQSVPAGQQGLSDFSHPATDITIQGAFSIITLMQVLGVPVLFPIHARKKVDFSQGIRLGAKDHLIDWTKPKRKPVWMSKQEYADLPETITVREFAVKGIVYVTTLLDAKGFYKQELAMLYKERWKIGLDFRSIKTNMVMKMLRCKTPDMVKKEMAIHLLAYNIIRGNLAQAASLHEMPPRQLSFRSAVQLVIKASRQIVSLTGDLPCTHY